jgi:hypothetical protein
MLVNLSPDPSPCDGEGYSEVAVVMVCLCCGKPGILTLPRLKPGDSRFFAAAYATAPRRACPARSMFFAAFSSRSKTNPQAGQTWVRTLRLLGTRSPQPLQSWLV